MPQETEEIDFTAASKEPYAKLESKSTYKFEFIDRIADHEEFKCGKKDPAAVWRVRDMLDGKIYRLTVTSTQLRDSLDGAAKALGGLEGKTLRITPEGEKKERQYGVKAIVPVPGSQGKLGV